MNYINEKEVGEIDIERVCRKWSPIVEALGVENNREFYSVYAETFQRLYGLNPIDLEKPEEENIPISSEEYEIRMKVDPFGEESWWTPKSKSIYENFSGTLLPLELKILSKLNLDNKNIILTNENTETLMIPITINEDLRYVGVDYAAQIEIMVMEILVRKINEKLETSNTFYINHMVSNVSIISDGTFLPKIVYKSKVGFA